MTSKLWLPLGCFEFCRVDLLSAELGEGRAALSNGDTGDFQGLSDSDRF